MMKEMEELYFVESNQVCSITFHFSRSWEKNSSRNWKEKKVLLQKREK